MVSKERREGRAENVLKLKKRDLGLEEEEEEEEEEKKKGFGGFGLRRDLEEEVMWWKR